VSRETELQLTQEKEVVEEELSKAKKEIERAHKAGKSGNQTARASICLLQDLYNPAAILI